MYKDLRKRKHTEYRSGTGAHTSAPQTKTPTGDKIVHPSIVPCIIGSIPLIVFWLVALLTITAIPDAPIWEWLLLLVFLTLLFIVRTVFWVMGATYQICSDSIVANVGIVSRRIVKVRTADIRSLSMSQSVTGRLFDYGSVEVYTAATSKAEIVMRAVPCPDRIVAELDALRPVKN